MACCGQRRTLVGASGTAVEPGRASRRVPNPAIYEYVGETAMTVIGAISGLHYRFGYPGAKVQIRPQDVPSMTGLPNLRRVQ